MVEVRRLGARFNLLQTPIHGRRPRQQQPQQLSLMHQDIHRMFLMHEIYLFLCPTPTSPPPSPPFAPGRSPSTLAKATLLDTGAA